MSKLVLNDVNSGFQSHTAVNTNNALIETALENTLSRDGTSPNQMGANLDMDSHRVINLAEPINANEAARLVDVQNAIAGNSTANLVGFTPYGNIASTTIQGAIQEEVDDLVASTGSSLIGFIQEDTGAVASTLASKLNETISVFDFLSAAQIADVKARTLTLDCTAAIQAAINAARGTLFFPPGSYKVSSSLNLTGKLGLFLEGSGNYGTSDAAIYGTVAIGNYPVLDFSQSNQCSIKSLSIRTYSTDVCYIGILLARVGATSSQGHVLEDVAVYGSFAHSCLYMSSSEECNIVRGAYETLSAGARAVTLIDVPEVGVTSLYKDITAPTGGNTVTRFENGRFLNLTNNASNRSFYIKTARHVQLHGLYINSGDSTHAIEITTSSLVSFTNVTFENEPVNAVSFNGANSNIEFRSCVFPASTGYTIEGAIGSTLTGLVIDINNLYNSVNAFSFATLHASRVSLGGVSTGIVTASVSNSYSRVPSVADLVLTSSSCDFITYESTLLPIYVNRAWGNFTVAGGAVTIQSSGNIANISYSLGNYTVTFTTAMPDTKYAVVFGFQKSSGTAFVDYTTATKAVGSFVIRNLTSAGVAEDPGEVSFIVIR